MAPKKMFGSVRYKEKLAKDIWLVGVDFDQLVDFVPGQYISLKVSDQGMRRSYSVARILGEKSIELLVDVKPMGIGSRYILDLKIGDPIEVLGFLGNFVVVEKMAEASKHVLFVGTGTGIAPLKPMIEDLLQTKKFKGDIRLIWGMRHEEDLYWVKEMEDIASQNDNFKFDLVMSKSGDDWPGLKGHVGDVIAKLKMDWPKTMAYLCGSPEMITETEEHLKGLGMADEQIFYEKYY